MLELIEIDNLQNIVFYITIYPEKVKQIIPHVKQTILGVWII